MPDCAPIQWTYQQQGDRSLLIRFSQTEQIDLATSLICAQAAQAIRASALPDIVDIVPSFNAVALHHRPGQLSQAGLQEHVDQVLRYAFARGSQPGKAKTIEIPVCYGAEYGPDLAELAIQIGVTEAELIRLHSQDTLRVLMLGFAPGAPYIGSHADALAVPRRATPRTHIAAGSVAVANRQSIIYPTVSPGGWHVIGRTPVTLFNPRQSPPTLLTAGDQIRFVPISQTQFLNWPPAQ